MAEIEPSQPHKHSFESIRREDDGAEYWLARELAPVLGYQDYRNFLAVVEKARTSAASAGFDPADHFGDVTKMVQIGSSAQRELADLRLSRYACYLIVQNGDPSKPIIAEGQTYFAVQTRRQEIQDDPAFGALSEDDRRLMLRREMAHHNTALASAAGQAGVVTGLDYAVFQDHGYRGLYGGRSMRDIHMHKGLKKSQKILDHMGSTELAANLFRATQTEDKLKRDGARTKAQANDIHRAVGRKVRATIGELGGVMPEHLPTPDASIQQLERRKAKTLKDDSAED
ncbi:MAG: DNA damage-inducible protein D [Alphaproteobacteria bacterium]|uniref:DNA damage-inducible protein D n=1 Tax=Brevundimonas sp. TaxID=1871086 RepID=UPI001D459AE8|nr:DNA damage-inducible protein D [Alphaproteobacteria bacterium]MBU1520932.1 DNA damage-inducible protein D [Alphaproteobacteria bacterium]MBU2232979.1 DNA damage-inducible protein D [Alphaproteobacteria bacterium]MBU2348736.1 DNA damage-inducible protein D [Alphaproteobacteria bacterium]MBU2400563.1 DNA damage-inducible protein D [Alphaproteobacteria bacterium]